MMLTRFNLALFMSVLIVLLFTTVGVFGFNLSINETRGDSFLTASAISPDETLIYPLLDQDILSSGWILNINGEYIIPAESGWVRAYREFEGKHRLIYTNKVYSFENSWILSENEKYIQITATFTNNSTETLRISPNLLLDTYLGEVTGLPFQLPDNSYVRFEQLFEGSDIPEWIKSSRSTDQPSLIIFTDGRVSTKPQSLILANWLRMKQAGSDFVPERGRTFDFLPFSEGDSAVLLKYKDKRLVSGGAMSVQLVIGLDNTPPVAGDFKQAVDISVNAGVETLRLREYTLRQRIREIRLVIDAIDNLFDNDEVITGEDVADIESKTVNQEKYRAEYENL